MIGIRIVIVGVCFSLMFAHQVASAAGSNSSASSSKPDEVPIAAPVADEVCFSPSEPCDIKLTKFIQSAKVSLDIAIFDINLDKIVGAILIQAMKIPVRVLVDRREAKGAHSAVSNLIKAGTNVKFGRQFKLMHNKFLIVDGKMIETGSFNYTNGAALKNNENQVYLATPSIIARYSARFEQLWKEADGPGPH